MAKKKVPKHLAEYRKQYNRIMQAVRRQKEAGYFVPKEIIPVSPSKLKSIRKTDVTRLSRITPHKIRAQSYYVDSESGEALKGYEPKRKKGRKNKRETIDPFFYPDAYEEIPEQHQEYYPGFEYMAIQGYRQQLKQFPNAEATKIMEAWLDRIIDTFGEHDAAVMLHEGSMAGNIITWETMYRGGYGIYMNDMMSFLPKRNDDEIKKLVELFEEFEDYIEVV